MSRKLNFRLLAVVTGTLVLAACGGVESKKIDYKSSGKLPPLEVPPDLTQPSRDDRYAVPDSTGKGATTTFSTYSGGAAQSKAEVRSDVLPQVSNMRIERSGSQRWLVVNGMAPDKLWPTVKDFWQETGFIINIETPEAGVMETDWAENRAKIPQDGLRNWMGKMLDSLYSTAERDKFRTRLEKGENGATEIYISHRGMYEVYVTEGRSETRWQPRPAEPELEVEMLRRLMVRLGATDAQSKTQSTAAASPAKAAPAEEKARLTRTKDGGGSLELQEGFDRAWRRVGLALDRVGFTVEDRDRSQGLYFVRYVDPESTTKKDKEGFASKLMFWKSEPRVDPNARYRIFLKGTGNSSVVSVLTREGGVDNSDTSRKILGLLHEQLK